MSDEIQRDPERPGGPLGSVVTMCVNARVVCKDPRDGADASRGQNPWLGQQCYQHRVEGAAL
eukprot:6555011-Lingulodinium_polyedra.AAC.1